MNTFTPSVKKAIVKTKEFDVNIIAPGHGPVYRDNPQKIINDYARFTEYSTGSGKNEICILWGSMYGMTKKAVNFVRKDILTTPTSDLWDLKQKLEAGLELKILDKRDVQAVKSMFGITQKLGIE